MPPQVQWFLSLCEVVNASYRYQDKHRDEPQAWFCEGVVDYWWEDNSTLEEPTLEMLWKDPFDSTEPHQLMPSHERFCYQQGAIVGYQLSERFNNGA